MSAAPSDTNRPKHREGGAALIVALVLLMALTLLGVSGMQTATLERTIANNAQFQQDAFRAAETGIEIAIAEARFLDPAEILHLDLGGSAAAHVLATFEEVTPLPPPRPDEDPPEEMQAMHFRLTALGRGARGAVSVQHQGLYVSAPAGYTLGQLRAAGVHITPVRTYWSEEEPQ